MSVARPAARSLLSRRCLAITPTTPTWTTTSQILPPPTGATCRQFHASAPVAAGRRRHRLTSKISPEYTERDKEILSRTYTKEQMDALTAGEAAIDPVDFTLQGRLRRDPYHLGYIDDFSIIDPVLDKRHKTKPPPVMKSRFMTSDEFGEDLFDWLSSFIPENLNKDSMTEAQLAEAMEKYSPSNLDILKYMTERSSMTDGGQGSNTALAPALPDKVPGVAGKYKRVLDPEDVTLDPEGNYTALKKQLGVGVRDITDLTSKHIVSRRVANQTRLGKVLSTSVITIVGNGNGRLGMGEAKSTEPSIASLKSKLAAIKNMVPIRRYEDRTIYGNVEKKVSGTVVQLFSRPPGFGLRVSHRIFEMCRAAGIKDLSARIPRSRNPMNTVKAAYAALTDQPDPEAIAMGRGKKLVDARKVYYGGAVY